MSNRTFSAPVAKAPTPVVSAPQAQSQEQRLEMLCAEIAAANGFQGGYTDALANSLIPLPLLNQLHMEYLEISDFDTFWFNVLDVKYNEGEDTFTFQARLSCCIADGLANPTHPRGSEDGAQLPHMNLYCKPKFPASWFSDREQEVLKEHALWFAENKNAAFVDMPKIFFEEREDGGCIRFDLRPYWSPKHGRIFLQISGLSMNSMKIAGAGFSAGGELIIERPAPKAVTQARDWSQLVNYVDAQIMGKPVTKPTGKAIG